MAKVNGGIESKISGMIGPVVFVNFNGSTYVRRAPRSRGKNGWSPNQQSSRTRFSEVCAFWRGSVPGSVKQIWGVAAEKMNGFNLFLKINLPAFGSDGKLADRERFHFSQGVLPLPHKLKAATIQGDPGKIEVNWQNESESGSAFSNDKLMLVAAGENNFTAPIETGAVRKQGSAIVQLPQNPDPVTGFYLFFKSSERNLYSTDQYFEIMKK